MKKKDESLYKNYLDRIPCRADKINWKTDENGIVILEIENVGIMNRIAQKFFKKPKISYIHLDETGSFIWPLINGDKTVFELGGCVKAEFGDAANPLYERLAKFFQILDSYGFVKWAD